MKFTWSEVGCIALIAAVVTVVITSRMVQNGSLEPGPNNPYAGGE